MLRRLTNFIYRSISNFNRNPLSVQTSFSLILDRLSKSNLRPNDRTNSLLTDGFRIYMRKSFEGTEKWFRTERGLQLKIEIDLYLSSWWGYGFDSHNPRFVFFIILWRPILDQLCFIIHVKRKVGRKCKVGCKCMWRWYKCFWMR